MGARMGVLAVHTTDSRQEEASLRRTRGGCMSAASAVCILLHSVQGRVHGIDSARSASFLPFRSENGDSQYRQESSTILNWNSVPRNRSSFQAPHFMIVLYRRFRISAAAFHTHNRMR